MPKDPAIKLNRNQIFWLSFFAITAFIVLKAVMAVPQLRENLSMIDNDSIMRLSGVQSWLAGQSWFDTIEYDLMPPEGVLMHWSRYIDAAVGGLIVAFSLVLPGDLAQVVAITVWPTFLGIVLVGLIGFGTRRLFGPMAASVAMLCVMVWPFTSQFYFLPGLIDHHNVQIVMIILMTFAIIWPSHPVRAGIVAGIAAAFGLAIGLETLIYIVAVGLLLFVRAHLGVTSNAARLLISFCIALSAGAVVFWLGQTPSDRLGVAVCDQLGLPVLSLIATASVASILPFLLIKERPVLRFTLSVGLIIAGLALGWSMLWPCIEGPYGTLPQEVQDIISKSISEARPAHEYASQNLMPYLRMAVPVIGAVVFAALLWAKLSRTTPEDRHLRDMTGQLILLAIVGFVASFSQIRLLLMSSAAVPVLAGFVIASLLQSYLSTRATGAALAFLGASFFFVAPHIIKGPLNAFLPDALPSTVATDGTCRNDDTLLPLNDIEPVIFLTSLNMGPRVILLTHHATIAGPYHRSPDAFANGALPFRMEETEMREYVSRTNATHLLLCETTNFSVGFARDLAAGAQADWLERVPIVAGDLMVFEIK